jgi:chemotaxis methyl-accepting protein methylase
MHYAAYKCNKINAITYRNVCIYLIIQSKHGILKKIVKVFGTETRINYGIIEIRIE